VIEQFKAWLRREAPAVRWEALMTDVKMLEKCLLAYFDHLYLDELREVSAGTAVLAAIAHFCQDLHQFGRRNLMPGLSRALQGWERLHPTGTRLPVPYPAWCGVIVELIRCHGLRMAAVTLVTLDAYLRPSEALNLTKEMLIPPQLLLSTSYRFWSILAHPWHHGLASKTHEFDDSVILDSSWRPALAECATWLFNNTSPGCRLADFTHAQWQRAVSQCADALGLAPLHLYTLRHSGPSEDHLRQKRTLSELKRRGRWLSETSVRRYEKGARLLSQMKSWTPAQKSHFQKCEDGLLESFLGRAPPPRLQVSPASGRKRKAPPAVQPSRVGRSA
jgi:hypothetical protein